MASAQNASPPATNDAIKETLESIVIAFILAFVFRAYVVEAFVIPTGSMAPTLLGQHVRIECKQCAYQFKSDFPKNPGPGSGNRSTNRRRNAICPMCHFPNTLKKGTRARSGDRILIHKFIYSLSPPNRWDIVVFKNPNQPVQNYIKRLVGLPDESLLLIEGNVYVKPRRAAEGWRIARKTDTRDNPHAIDIQGAVWQPVYHSAYRPLDRGSNDVRQYTWGLPWKAQTGKWDLDRRDAYWHRSASEGVLVFEFKDQARHNSFRWYAYNQFHDTQFTQPIEEIRLAARFLPEQRGLAICLRTTARLDQEEPDARPIMLSARIEADGRARLEATDTRTGDVRVLAERPGPPLPGGVATAVELWYVDQEVILWVNGQACLIWAFEFEDIKRLINREPLQPNTFPELAIEVSGSPVGLFGVQVDRDLAYTSHRPNLRSIPGRGAILKRSNGESPKGNPLDILPDQYFCLGDNSPLSHDGRFWQEDQLNQWVRDTMFKDPEHRTGVVPEKLMIGRAFFIYFPAPFPLLQNGIGVLPNFGEMRFIR